MLNNIIKVAKGEQKADLVLKNASIINVFTNEIYKITQSSRNTILLGFQHGSLQCPQK